MMVQMIPRFLTNLYLIASKTWMHFGPWVGQQALITDVLGGRAPSVLFFVAAALNLVIAAVTLQGTAALRHREKIILGRSRRDFIGHALKGCPLRETTTSR